jgi:hypothetical protein
VVGRPLFIIYITPALEQKVLAILDFLRTLLRLLPGHRWKCW